MHRLSFLRNSSTGKKPGGRPKLQQKERKKRKRESDKKIEERTKSLKWQDGCACTNEKVVQSDSGEKKGRILPFKGRFESLGAILAYNRPKKVKNV